MSFMELPEGLTTDVDWTLESCWNPNDCPETVLFQGEYFDTTWLAWPVPGSAAQYRDRRRYNSRHLVVMKDGRVFSHLEAHNPRFGPGPAVEHLIEDVPTGHPARRAVGAAAVVLGLLALAAAFPR